MTSDSEERLRQLRHDLANPLSAILAETQLLLLSPEDLNDEVTTSLREMERLARRMREMLQSE